jgi:Na+/melibiose symporter-like transporter
MMSLIPAAFCLLAAFATLLYRLDDKRMKEIERQLVARRANSALASM